MGNKIHFIFFLNFFLLAQIQARQNHNLIFRIYRHTAFLAADSLEGRGTGSKGEKIAADYIANELAKAKLQPFGTNNSWFQSIPMHGSRPLIDTRINLTNNGQRLRLQLGRDFLLFHSGAQTFIPTPTQMVFVGYGISAPEFDYNDYQSVDVQGKIVVFLAGEPYSEDENYFGGPIPTVYSYAESKQRMAIAHGAIGSILLHIPDRNDQESWMHFQQAFSFEDVTLAYRVTNNLSVFLNTPDSIAAFLFKNSGYSLHTILEMVSRHALHPFPIKTRLQFKGRFMERDFISHNIAGILPANTLFNNDEYVIVSAHYDHLGIGLPVDGDSIYNGAMDNAIGVAAVLELARILNTPEIRRKRSLIFLLLTGEEKGLLGSAYYTDHPLAPLYKTIANLNVDGMAIFDTFKNIVGVGAEYSDLGKLLKDTAETDSLTVAPVPPMFLQYESFSRSDQMSFAWAGIPSILIMDGLNYRHLTSGAGLQKWLDWNRHIYHSPFDDLHQPVNWQATAQHVHFLADFLQTLLNTEKKIQWKNGLPFKNIRLQTIAEHR